MYALGGEAHEVYRLNTSETQFLFKNSIKVVVLIFSSYSQ